MESNIVVIIFLIILIAFLEIKHYFRERTLLDRLIVKDINDLTYLEKNRRIFKIKDDKIKEKKIRV